MAGARRLHLLGEALFLRTWPRHRYVRRGRAGIEYGLAEVAGQRWSKLRHRLWKPGIIARQVREPVRRVAVVRVEEFVAGCVMLRLQSEEQRASYTDGRGSSHTEQHLTRQPRHRRPPGAQPHLLGRARSLTRPFLLS